MIPVLHAIDTFCKYGWPAVLGMDWYLRIGQRYRRRMARGKAFRWERRTLGPQSGLVVTAIVLPVQVAEWIASGTWYVTDAFIIYVAVSCVIDFITGDDDPPYRRWLTSLSQRIKFSVSPPPRPIIER